MTQELTLFLDKLKEFAISQPNKCAWTFLDDHCRPVDQFTYGQLDTVTTVLAQHLLEQTGIKPGERALLVFFPGLHFMISLLACFKAKIIAVPVFPPDPRRQQKDLHHFVSIQTSCQAQVAITHSLYNFAKKVSDIKHFFTSNAKDISWPTLK